MRICFGPFAFDPQSRLLWRDESEIALPPRVLGVLELLLERAGQVVARQDLLDRVWKDSFVTDTSLAEAVSFLRQALGDDPQAPRYIQTIHRRGYRFLVVPTAQGLTAPAAPAADVGQAGGQAAAAETGSGHIAANGAVQEATADWQLVPWSIALLCAGLAIAAVWHGVTRQAPEPEPVVRYELRTAAGTAFDEESQAIAVARDGRTLAWSACETAGGRCSLYLRAIDRLDAQPVAGTDGGHSPVFSPDGRWIAFFADGALKKVAASGGTAATLASAPDPAGLAWGADGRIAFAASAASGISIVDEQGGTAQALTSPRADRGELRHHHPAWLDGRGLLFIVSSAPEAGASTELAAMANGANGIRILRSGVQRAVPADGGYLILGTANDVQATTFDPQRLLLTGASDVMPGAANGGAPAFAATTRTLAILRTPPRIARLWRDGTDAPALAKMTAIAVSPDARRAAGVINEGGNTDIWTADLASNAMTRVTYDGTNVSPAWSADGERLFFATRSGTTPFRVVSTSVGGHTNASIRVPGAPPQAFPSSAAPDGSVAVTAYKDGRTSVAIVSPGGALRTLTDGPFDESNASFSPDGRFVAVVSTASGRAQILVRSVTDGRRVQVSPDGGTRAWWSEDGRAVYFVSGRRVLKAAIDLSGALSVSTPEIVLDVSDQHPITGTRAGRILVDRQPSADAAVVVLHWLGELRERLPLPVNAPR